MKILLFVVTITLLIVVQTLYFHFPTVGPYLPNFGLVMAVVAGYRLDMRISGYVGALIGFIEDALSLNFFGLNILIKSLICFFVGFIHIKLIVDLPLTVGLLAFVLTFIEYFITGYLYTLGSPVVIEGGIYTELILNGISNMLAALVLNQILIQKLKYKVQSFE